MSQNKPVLIALILTGLLLVGLGAYFILGGDSESEVETAVELPPEKPVIEVQPKPEPPPMPDPLPVTVDETEPPAFVLPRLDTSDQLIRDGAVSLTRHEGINTWLGTDELIRKTVAFTDNIARGNVAKQPAQALAPKGQISVQEVQEGVYVMNPQSFDRFNNVTNILLSLDTERAVEFYLLLRPLFQQAYQELGYPSGTFDEAILAAIGRLLETPDVPADAKLVRPVVMYEYQDKKIESLSPAQKQLLRMGPKNAQAVKDKLRDIARELRATLN